METMQKMRRLYHRWFGMSARRHCPHVIVVGIYGDEINRVGGWRLQCVSCGRYLNGPVSLATK